MKRSVLMILIGLTFLAVSAPALGHHGVTVGVPQAGITIYGDSSGQVAWAGTFNLGPLWISAPLVSHGHGPVVKHSPRYGGGHHHGCRHGHHRAKCRGHKHCRQHRHGHH